MQALQNSHVVPADVRGKRKRKSGAGSNETPIPQKPRLSASHAQAQLNPQLPTTAVSQTQRNSDPPLSTQRGSQAAPSHTSDTPPVLPVHDITHHASSPTKRTRLHAIVQALLSKNNTPCSAPEILVWIVENDSEHKPLGNNKRDGRVSATLSQNLTADKPIVEKLVERPDQDHGRRNCRYRLRQDVQEQLCKQYADLVDSIEEVYSKCNWDDQATVLPEITPPAQDRLFNNPHKSAVAGHAYADIEGGFDIMADGSIAQGARPPSVTIGTAAGSDGIASTEQSDSTSPNAFVQENEGQQGLSHALMWRAANQRTSTETALDSNQGETQHISTTSAATPCRSLSVSRVPNTIVGSSGNAWEAVDRHITPPQTARSSEARDGSVEAMPYNRRVENVSVGDQERHISSTPRGGVVLGQGQEQLQDSDVMQDTIDDPGSDTTDNASLSLRASTRGVGPVDSTTDDHTSLREGPNHQPEAEMVKIWERLCSSADIVLALRQHDSMQSRIEEASKTLEQRASKHEELRKKEEGLIAEMEDQQRRLRQLENELTASDLGIQESRRQLDVSVTALEEARKEGAQRLKQIWHYQQ